MIIIIIIITITPKLVQRIKMKISCDERVYTWKIVPSRAQSRAFSFSYHEFEPSGSAPTLNHSSFKR